MHAPRLPSYVQLALWATPGADTWRGPSHDTLELLNPEGFSFKAPGREPGVREDRKTMVDANAFRQAISPLPVLLFGVTALRVTCNDMWAHRKALKSRQRAILDNLEA